MVRKISLGTTASRSWDPRRRGRFRSRSERSADNRSASSGERRIQAVPEPQGRQERRLHSGAGQGRSESVRHRAGHRRRQGLHGRRCDHGSLDSVDLQGLHDGAGDPGAGAGIHRETDRRRCHRREIQLHHRDRGRALGGGNRRAGDERAREPRRDLVHQHGARFERRCDLGKDHRLPQRRRRSSA